MVYSMVRLNYLTKQGGIWNENRRMVVRKQTAPGRSFTDRLGNSKIPFWGLRGNRKDHFPIDFVCHCKIREPAALPPGI